MGTDNRSFVTIWNLFHKSECPQIVNYEMLYEKLFDPSLKMNSVWEMETFSSFAKKEEEFGNFIITPCEIMEGILKCDKCKCKKIFSFSKQTRSGDESTTVFAKCSNCQHQWIQ